MKECPTCHRCFADHINHCDRDGAMLVVTIPGENVLDGRYELKRQLGQGGMGAVYEARHSFLNTLHAVKVILPEFLVGNDPEFVRRFRQEALAAANIRHPNVIRVTDYGLSGGTTPFLVMDLIRGKILQDLLAEEQRLTPERALELMEPIMSGVGAAHKLGIVHRDLKPLNIIIEEGLPLRDAIKVLDFGLAKIKTGELLGSFVAAKSSGVMGSPPYMAPEQWSEEEFDARTDIYSLGIILYQMLTGTVPFKGASAPTIMKKHLMDEPPRFAELGVRVPSGIEDVVRHALEKNPDHRPQTVANFLEELRDSIAAARRKSESTPSDTLTAAEWLVCDESPTSLEPELGQTTLHPTGGACLRAEEEAHPGAEVEVSYPPGREGDVSDGEGISLETSPPLSRPDVSEVRVERDPHTPHKPATNSHYSRDPANSPASLDGNLTFHLRRHDGAAADVAASASAVMRYPEISYVGVEHIYEELILHEDYERLWHSLMHAKGGCNVLTGYGRFGGTSLVRCAAVKARAELQPFSNVQTALLISNFNVRDETKESFTIEAAWLGLDPLNGPEAHGHNADLKELRHRAVNKAEEEASVLELQLDRPVGATFFKPSSATELKADAVGYDFSNLIADLNDFFNRVGPAKELRQIISRLVRSENLPSRVVFIIDRVRHLETLETLAASEFFSNRKIRVIVLTRKEDFDSWENAGPRLEAIGFSKWYVPCLWGMNFGNKLFHITPENEGSAESLRLFLKHMEYVGRGSLVNIINELKRAEIVSFREEFNYVNLSVVVKRGEIQHNAWVQGVLDVNWATILGHHFGGADQDERTDRARIGVYYLMDWTALRNRFTKAEILDAALSTEITISNDNKTLAETVENLLFVLTRNGYLRLRADTYHIVWDKNKQPMCRSVKPRNRVGTTRHSGKPIESASSVRGLIPPDKQTFIRPVDQARHQLTQPSLTSPPPLPAAGAFPSLLTSKSDASNDPNIAPGRADWQTGFGSDLKKVFISYSHADRGWLSRLRLQLRPIEREGLIELWDDTRIETGAAWRKEIQDAIRSAKIAILL